MTTLEKRSPAKVNLLLNILGKRSDGFHALETVFHPVQICDHLQFTTAPSGIALTCNHPELPTDTTNLVHRAASQFFATARLTAGVRIHLEKKLPLAAGLGGGSANAATTLLALNELFDHPLGPSELGAMASTLGSDVNFFLQPHPALATGRGEMIMPLPEFAALRNTVFLLIHPGFGIATPWAYRELARFPTAQNGQPGRAAQLITALQTGPLTAAAPFFYNSLEAPALEKFPVLRLYQEFLCEHGAHVALMSGSGSTTFAIFPAADAAAAAAERFQSRFGDNHWQAIVPVAFA